MTTVTQTPSAKADAAADPSVTTELTEAFDGFMHNLGDDVKTIDRKHYRAYAREDAGNVACVETKTRLGELRISVPLDPDSVELEEGFTRDLRGIGHLGTGNLEIRIGSKADLRKAQKLLRKAYKDRKVAAAA